MSEHEEPVEAIPTVEEVMPAGKDALQEFGDLYLEEKRLDSLLAAKKARRQQLEPIVKQFLSEHGLKSVRAAGVTIFIERKIWARAVEVEGETMDEKYERSCAALRAAGWDEYVQTRFNVPQLSARVRELSEQADRDECEVSDLLPPEFEGAIAVDEEFKAKARQGKK